MIERPQEQGNEGERQGEREGGGHRNKGMRRKREREIMELSRMRRVGVRRHEGWSW